LKIKNYSGRSWLSQFDRSGLTVHIVNAEIAEATLKGSNLVIRITSPSERRAPGDRA